MTVLFNHIIEGAPGVTQKWLVQCVGTQGNYWAPWWGGSNILLHSFNATGEGLNVYPITANTDRSVATVGSLASSISLPPIWFAAGLTTFPTSNTIHVPTNNRSYKYEIDLVTGAITLTSSSGGDGYQTNGLIAGTVNHTVTFSDPIGTNLAASIYPRKVFASPFAVSNTAGLGFDATYPSVPNPTPPSVSVNVNVSRDITLPSIGIALAAAVKVDGARTVDLPTVTSTPMGLTIAGRAASFVDIPPVAVTSLAAQAISSYVNVDFPSVVTVDPVAALIGQVAPSLPEIGVTLNASVATDARVSFGIEVFDIVPMTAAPEYSYVVGVPLPTIASPVVVPEVDSSAGSDFNPITISFDPAPVSTQSINDPTVTAVYSSPFGITVNNDYLASVSIPTIGNPNIGVLVGVGGQAEFTSQIGVAIEVGISRVVRPSFTTTAVTPLAGFAYELPQPDPKRVIIVSTDIRDSTIPQEVSDIEGEESPIVTVLKDNRVIEVM